MKWRNTVAIPHIDISTYVQQMPHIRDLACPHEVVKRRATIIIPKVNLHSTPYEKFD